jgi:hypothetical protein
VTAQRATYLILCVGLPAGMALVLTAAMCVAAGMGKPVAPGTLLAGLGALAIGMPLAFGQLRPARRKGGQR